MHLHNCTCFAFATRECICMGIIHPSFPVERGLGRSFTRLWKEKSKLLRGTLQVPGECLLFWLTGEAYSMFSRGWTVTVIIVYFNSTSALRVWAHCINLGISCFQEWCPLSWCVGDASAAQVASWCLCQFSDQGLSSCFVVKARELHAVRTHQCHWSLCFGAYEGLWDSVP